MSFMSSFKGILGETVINVAMWLKLDKDVYHRLNNITLPLTNGGSTQIDHVIVSVYGIFVIETKNYKGWIFGNEKQRQWTQVIMGRKYKFQNPLRQNYLHIKTLAELLALDTSYFHSMIAFIGECELKTRDELPEHVLTSGMASYVKKQQEMLLTEDEVKAIVEQIESNRFSKSWRTNRAHKAYLKDKHSPSNKQSTHHSESKVIIKPAPNSKATTAETIKSREVLKGREVLRWSGQTEVAGDDAAMVTSINMHPINEQLNNEQLNNEQLNNEKLINDEVFITPFEVLESEPKMNEPATIEQVDAPIVSSDRLTCPKCHSEMIKRVAKKGARQGQTFYGCSQFPKCRSVINVD